MRYLLIVLMLVSCGRKVGPTENKTQGEIPTVKVPVIVPVQEPVAPAKPPVTPKIAYPIEFKINNLDELLNKALYHFDTMTLDFQTKSISDYLRSDVTLNALGKEQIVDLKKEYKMNVECKYVYQNDTIVFYKNGLLYKFEVPRSIRPFDDASSSPVCVNFVWGRHLFSKAQIYQAQNILESTRNNFISILKNKYIESTDKSESIKLIFTEDSVYVNSYLVVKYDSKATNLENMFESEEHKKFDYFDYKEKFELPVHLNLLVLKVIKEYGGLNYTNSDDGDYNIVYAKDLLTD